MFGSNTDIYDDFRKVYGDSSGIISGQKKDARLIAVTTSSSMGVHLSITG